MSVLLRVRTMGVQLRCIFSTYANIGDGVREIRVWTTGGDVVYTLSGHTSFVYSVAVLPGGEIASGGEDRTLRLWRGNTL